MGASSNTDQLSLRHLFAYIGLFAVYFSVSGFRLVSLGDLRYYQ